MPPVVAETNQSVTSVVDDFHTVALPAGIQAGDLLIVVLGVRFARDLHEGGAEGWNVVTEGPTSGEVGVAALWRIADGDEGASVEVEWAGAGGEGAHRSFRITGHDPNTPPEGTVGSIVSTNAPDPPEHAASWGAAPALAIAVGATTQARTITGYPDGYTGGEANHSESEENTAVGMGTAYRDVTAAAEDPGEFTSSGAGFAIAATIMVRGGEAAGEPLPTPTGFQVQKVPNQRQATATWNPSAGAGRYQLELQRQDGAGWVPETVVDPAVSPQTLTQAHGLDWGQTYRARVRAMPEN